MILPYIEQAPSISSSKLDERGTASTTAKLITQMPKNLSRPGSKPPLAKDGKTTSVVPVGEKTILRTPRKGPKLYKITTARRHDPWVGCARPQNAVVMDESPTNGTSPQDPGRTACSEANAFFFSCFFCFCFLFFFFFFFFLEHFMAALPTQRANLDARAA